MPSWKRRLFTSLYDIRFTLHFRILCTSLFFSLFTSLLSSFPFFFTSPLSSLHTPNLSQILADDCPLEAPFGYLEDNPTVRGYSSGFPLKPSFLSSVHLYGGFHKWGSLKMDGLQWKIRSWFMTSRTPSLGNLHIPIVSWKNITIFSIKHLRHSRKTTSSFLFRFRLSHLSGS